ncbi:glycosyl hydrolase family 95 catalytic domain-containing protein [Mucilaginibacter antarcticus]|uniref:Glycosyl hydrolase family 95 catalytic domain-containing protein n=1 Tax=Mucilaginibacter antarcticus TaxID=1855725 RepID=A0ABW5XKM2_9SPHI
MKRLLFCVALLLSIHCVSAQVSAYQNIWNAVPQRIPNNVSVDAPLLGNGDVLTSIGFGQEGLRFYLSKNDFWRLVSKADKLSGPRVAGFFDIQIADFKNPQFSAKQLLSNGVTTVTLQNQDGGLEVKSWVAATDNLIFIEMGVFDKPFTISLRLNAPENRMVQNSKGKAEDVSYLSRQFKDNVDIPTRVSTAFKVLGHNSSDLTLMPGKKVTVVIAMESLFKQRDPLGYVAAKVKGIDTLAHAKLWAEHNNWWQKYWQMSSLYVGDHILMKAYYQGLYTMAACARDEKFPPALFGWNTSDTPFWNGDYHMNYNFSAPFYALATNNRLQQARVHDAPLLDFMPRANWYAKEVTHTRGLLIPVGIGPAGIEVSRDFPVMSDGGYTIAADVEAGGLFYRQRSNALFGTLNMAQYWRTTYDVDYGKKIYPYVLGVIEFWEDYLTLKDGRYVIYKDAEGERSNFSKNPAKTIAMLRNALDLIIDLSANLKQDVNRQAKWKDMLARMSDYPTYKASGINLFRAAEEDNLGRQVYNASFELIYPGNGVTLNSSTAQLVTARNTLFAMQRWQDYNYTNSYYMAAIRAGYDSVDVIKNLERYALDTYPNGFKFDNPHGVENSCTVANALAEMMCMSVDNVIRLFRVWPKVVAR